MVERMNSSMKYLIYCKNFCKCRNVTPLSTIKKNKNKNLFMDKTEVIIIIRHVSNLQLPQPFMELYISNGSL
jgi:hypothetical protein